MKTLQLSKPHFIIMIGTPKSGKSTFASRFGDTFNAPYIDASSFHSVNNTVAETMQTVEYVLNQLFKTQQTIIYEGLSGSRVDRLAAAKLARAKGYEPLIVWVQTDTNVARTRASKRSKQNPYPLTAEEFEQEMKRFTPPNTSETYVVLSGLHTYASQAKTVLKRLSASKDRKTHPAPERQQSSRTNSRPIRIQ